MSLNNVIREFKRSFGKLLLDKKVKEKKDLDIKNAKSFLFLRADDKIGDMVINTISFREIKKKYPQSKILVLCGKQSAEIIKYNRYIDEIIFLSGKFYRDFFIYLSLRKKKIDIVVDLFEFNLKPLQLFALRLISPSFLIGLYKSGYKTFDYSIEEYFFDKHITQRHRVLLKLLGIDNPSLEYDIFTSERERNETLKYIQAAQEKIKIVLNPFAASKHRTFRSEKLSDLINLLKKTFDCAIFILCAKNNLKLVKNFENSAENIFVFCGKSILSATMLIKDSNLIISPDTSIVHIASAFKKKTVALYLDFSNREEKTDIIWGPNNPNACIINVDTQNGKLENDICNIANDKIIEMALAILKT